MGKLKDFFGKIGSQLSDGLGGAILGTIADVGGSFLNSYFSEKAANKQYERQLDFWNKQNEYQSPANQRKLLEDAGLNASAVLTEGVQDIAGTPAQVPGNDFVKMGQLGSIADTMVKLAQARSLNNATEREDDAYDYVKLTRLDPTILQTINVEQAAVALSHMIELDEQYKLQNDILGYQRDEKAAEAVWYDAVARLKKNLLSEQVNNAHLTGDNLDKQNEILDKNLEQIKQIIFKSKADVALSTTQQIMEMVKMALVLIPQTRMVGKLFF